MRPALFAILILVAGSQPAHVEPRLDPLLPGPLVEPLRLPVPQVEPGDPGSLLDSLKEARAIKVDISGQGLIDFSTITGLRDEIPACKTRPAVPLLSAYAPLPFVASLEVGRTDAGLSVGDNLPAASLNAGDLAVRLGTDLDLLLGFEPRGKPVQVAQQVELPLEILWRGKSFEVNLLSLTRLPEWDFRLVSAPQDLEPQLAEGGGQPIATIGGSKSLLSAELRREQSYLVGDVSLYPLSANEPGDLQPRASIRIREQDRVPAAELRASLEIARELAQGRCVDLMLEYSSELLSLQPEQRIRVRLAF